MNLSPSFSFPLPPSLPRSLSLAPLHPLHPFSLYLYLSTSTSQTYLPLSLSLPAPLPRTIIPTFETSFPLPLFLALSPYPTLFYPPPPPSLPSLRQLRGGGQLDAAADHRRHPTQ